MTRLLFVLFAFVVAVTPMALAQNAPVTVRVVPSTINGAPEQTFVVDVHNRSSTPVTVRLLSLRVRVGERPRLANLEIRSVRTVRNASARSIDIPPGTTVRLRVETYQSSPINLPRGYSHVIATFDTPTGHASGQGTVAPIDRCLHCR